MAVSDPSRRIQHSDVTTSADNKLSNNVLSSSSKHNSQSAKGHHKGKASVPTQLDAKKYKTELCKSFATKGICPYGAKCQFAHGEKELRSRDRHPLYKTRICARFVSQGYCPYNDRCTFIHPPRDNDDTCTFIKSEAPDRNSDLQESINSNHSAGVTSSVQPSTDPVVRPRTQASIEFEANSHNDETFGPSVQSILGQSIYHQELSSLNTSVQDTPETSAHLSQMHSTRQPEISPLWSPQEMVNAVKPPELNSSTRSRISFADFNLEEIFMNVLDVPTDASVPRLRKSTQKSYSFAEDGTAVDYIDTMQKWCDKSLRAI